jgi:molecular chaperone GrpE
MEEDKRGPTDANEPPANATPDDRETAATGEPVGSAEAASDAVSGLAAEIETLRAENTDLKDKVLRLMAEMENLRRRTDRDKSEFSKYAISEFAREIIGVGDNIRRAIQAVPKDAVTQDSVLHSFVEGVEVTERELLKILEKHQIKRFDPQGEPFNPHLHEAMTKIDVPNVPADTVVQVIHAGYMIGERVLRPAAVIVAKGGQGSDASKNGGKAGKSDKDEPIPPGAMKIPENVVSTDRTAGESAGDSGHPDMQQPVLGREFQGRRRQNAASTEGAERVAQFRRPRSPAGDQSFSEVRPNNGPSSAKPSALHKPVISRND